MRLYEEFKEYENLWDSVLKEEKEFRSEYARLKSTPEGREKLSQLLKNDSDAFYQLLADDRAVDPVIQEIDKALDECGDFELEFDGFIDDSYDEYFDPERGYGQIPRSVIYGNFTYTVDADSMLDLIYEDMLPKYYSKHADEELVKEWLRLDKILENSSKETEEEAGNAIVLHVAKNLEDFFMIFVDEIYDHYEDDAYESARERGYDERF